MNPRETEVSDALELLSQAIGSLHHDASVQLLTGIVQTFEDEHVNLSDFILALSTAIFNRLGSDSLRIIQHLEEAATAAAEMQQNKQSTQ